MTFNTIAVRSVAGADRERISQRTSQAMRRRQSAGECMSRIAPYGWREDPESPIDPASGRHMGMIADEHEQATIALIVNGRRARKSLRQIGRELTAAGIQCRGGSRHHQTIKKILDAPV